MPKSILVVEDEAAIVSALEKRLSDEGYIITQARDGAEALEILKKNTFDLILLDLMMPNTDGWAVLTALKGKGFVIVIISNLDGPEEIARARQLGAIDYWIKSDSSLDEFTRKVENVLNEKESTPTVKV